MAPERTPEGRLQLLRRPDCGLCEDIARDLRRLRLTFDEIDIEQEAGLEDAYGEVIPVLLCGAEEVARAPQSEQSLRDALRSRGLL